MIMIMGDYIVVFVVVVAVANLFTKKKYAPNIHSIQIIYLVV